MKKNTHSILFAKNFYLVQELAGIAEVAREQGWQLEIPQLFDLRAYIRNWRGSAIFTDTPWALDRLRREGVRIVGLALEPELAEKADALVVPDNLRIGEIGAMYFLHRGYRHFAVCRDCYGRDRAFRDRLGREGYTAVTLAVPRYFRSPEFRGELAGQLMKLPRPCAVFCNNDWEAAAVIHAAQMIPLRIPEELAVAGVGNETMICTTTAPGISSIDTRLRERGRRAALELQKLLEGNPAPAAPVLIPPGEMIERGSSNFFAVADPLLRRMLRELSECAATPVRVGELERRYHRSGSAIYRLFAEGIGMSPKAFLEENRLRLARTRLLDSGDTMEAIAQDCGFPSANAFFEQFRKRYGISPAQWRKRECIGYTNSL